MESKVGEPVLFILSGLPGAGKSTLGKLLAKKCNAVFLRIDTVERGLRELCNYDVQGEGYRMSYRIAADNLKLGINVIADSCNPIELTRMEWEEVAKSCGCQFINIEIICSDKAEHKRRLETRVSDVSRLQLPTWEQVMNREYHPWKDNRILIDTANKTIEESFKELKKILAEM